MNVGRTREPIVRLAGEGREYRMPAMRAVFLADGEETGDAYSISEWRLEPKSDGPGAHSHEANDEIFRSVDGTYRSPRRLMIPSLPASRVHLERHAAG